MDPADGVVLVVTPEGSAAGTGFVVADTLLVTCSHVVQGCSAQSRDEGRPETVEVIFHATGDTREARVRADATVVPEWWRGCNAEDIAFLRVRRVPDGVTILSLGSADGVERDEVHTFGYPEAGEVEGLGGSGRVVQPVKESGRPLLQLNSSEITSGFSGAPLWDRQRRRVIGVVTSILRPDRYGKLGETAFATPTRALQAICPALRVSDVCPYLGLNPFEADDAEFFFGRERLIEGLVSKLRANPRFLALLGPSGSGKSSVIRAGLVPRLAAGALPGSRGWGTVIIRPGVDPFTELAQSGLGGKQLAESFRLWMSASGKKRGVLVIDQFEELLVTTPASVRADFIAQLADLLDSSLPVAVVLVMRNDFYGRLDDSAPALLRWVEQGLLNVLPLDQNELAEIVAEPAKNVGLDFEEGLVGVITEEAMAMRSEGDAITSTVLPLVEFALTELWEQSHQEGRLTHEAYRALRGISGALTQWADGAYYELGDQQRPIARTTFLDLVHVADEGEQMPATRERRDISALCPAIDDRGSVEAVVNQLAAKRLVIISREKKGRATVELIHDALIREWEPLRAWISEERPFRRWLQESEAALRSWIEYVRGNHQGEEPDWLRGRRLVQAEHWLGNRGADLSHDLQGFIQASVEVRDEEAERERKQLANEQERRQALRVSESLRLASEARQAIRSEPDTAFLVAWEAILRDRNELTESVFRETLSQMAAPVKILRPASEPWGVSVEFAPSGDFIFAASAETGGVDVWSLDGMRLSHFTVEGSGAMAIAPIPGLSKLLTWRDHVLRLHWIDGAILDELPLTKDRSVESALQRLGLSMTEAGICLVQVGGRGWVAGIDGAGNTLRLLHSLTFSPDDLSSAIHPVEENVFTAHLDRRAHTILTEGSDAAGIWTLDGLLRTVLRNAGGVAGGDFLGDGRIVTSTMRGAGYLWDSDGNLLAEFKPANGTRDLYIQAVDANGGCFATTVNRSGITEVWTSSGELVATLRGHEGHVWSGAFSADDKLLATGGEDRTVLVYDWRRETNLLELRGHDSTVNQVAFHPANPALLLSASHDGSVRLWTLETTILPPFRGHDQAIDQMTSTSAGILSSSRDGTSRVWRPDGASTKLPGKLVSWCSASISPATVLTDDSSGVTYLWKVSSSGDSTQRGIVRAELGSEVPGLRGVVSPDGSRFILMRGTTANLYSDSGEHLCNLVGASPRDGQGEIIGGGFRYDAGAIVAAAEDGTVWLWNSNGSPIGTFLADLDMPLSILELHPKAAQHGTPDEIKSICLDPSGEYILFGLRGRVCFWSWDCQLRQELRPAGYKVFQLAFMPDASRIVTIAENPSRGPSAYAQLWDRSGSLIASLYAPDVHSLTEIHCDPESRYFCLKSNATIRIFDRSGQPLGTLAAARGVYVVSMAIQSNGALVAALFSDGLARIWDLGGKRRAITLAVGQATSVLFSSDSSRLLTASSTGLIEQHALNVEDLFPAAALRIDRELTAEEIDRFAIQQPIQFELNSYRKLS